MENSKETYQSRRRWTMTNIKAKNQQNCGLKKMNGNDPKTLSTAPQNLMM